MSLKRVSMDFKQSGFEFMLYIVTEVYLPHTFNFGKSFVQVGKVLYIIFNITKSIFYLTFSMETKFNAYHRVKNYGI